VVYKLMNIPSNRLRASIIRQLALSTLYLRRSLVRLIKRLLYPELRPGQAMGTVLVFRTGRLGDFLNAVPALALLRSRLPQARIILATTLSSQPLVQSIASSYADPKSLPWLEFVTPSLVDCAMCFTMAGRDRGLAAMRRAIREEHPGVIFVLPYIGESIGGKLKKLLFFRLAGFRGPIFGFDGLPSRNIFQRSQYQLGMYEHQVFGPVRAVSECAAIGVVEERDIVLQVSVPAGPMNWARKLLQASALTDTVLVAICPGATSIHKVWPIDRYVAVCRELSGCYDCRFVVVGSAADRSLGETLHDALGDRCLDMTGKTSVTQLAALIKLCHLFVGNDGGVAHLASAVGCHAVTITSAFDFPGMWEPWNSRRHVLRVHIDCEYCLAQLSCPRKTNACIAAVDTREVLRMCAQVLGPAVEHAGSRPIRILV
jgi:ADP-heptose:LPS heptosyltransferase